MRFKVVEGSQSAHCCFDATVVDTAKPGWGADRYEPVCECFEFADAERIAAALNTADSADHDRAGQPCRACGGTGSTVSVGEVTK